MEKLEISVPSVIPKAFMAVIDLLERYNGHFTWKTQRNFENVSLMVTSVPAKSVEVPFQPFKASGQPASEGTPLDSAHPAKDPFEGRSKKKKKKTPSTIARHKAMRRRYRQAKAVRKKAAKSNATSSHEEVPPPH